VEIQFHKRYWRVGAIVECIVLAARADPGKVRLVKMGFEVLQAVFEDSGRVICIEGFEELEDLVLLLAGEELDWASL
jgi:predicted site-specific integrase-resolvase